MFLEVLFNTTVRYNRYNQFKPDKGIMKNAFVGFELIVTVHFRLDESRDLIRV